MRTRSVSYYIVTVLTIMVMLSGGVAESFLSKNGVTPYVPGPGDPYPDYLTSPNWAYSPPLRKFKDTLPELTAAGINNLGQYIPIATPDIVTYPGSDYYVIELRQFSEQMHRDLANPTTLRGYVQGNSGTDTSACYDPALPAPPPLPAPQTPCVLGDNTVTADPIHYLGPLIIAQKDRPVRVLFKNMINPSGGDGDLFLPVDGTIMGSGPYEINYSPIDKDGAVTGTVLGNFSTNRATLHLHGGRSPWISDGTPHQWVAPAGDDPAYPQGVSVEHVPDMPIPAPNTGQQTFFWTNQQSARMMFYHDHAWGITRLNVYAGEAAGYLIQDQLEDALIYGGAFGGRTFTAGTIPADQIPLVIQDKTFVDAATIGATDPTWNWGTGALATGSIQTAAVLNGGTGYTAGLVTLVGTNSNATATITVTGGVIDSIAITGGGSGYTNGETVTINDGASGTGGTATVHAINGRQPVTGDLWWPHVYMPAQNPFDITGIAPLGRWAYGPYFWPATNNPYQPIPNPYWDEAGICDPTLDPTPGDGLTPADIAWNEANVPGYTTINGAPFCQMPQIPSTPNPSWGAEAFMDTPVINGTAYPVLNVNPQAYRLRILNAAHDRFQNLSLFVADTLDPNTAIEDDLTTPMDEGTLTTASAALCATYTGLPNPGCATNTEVRMVPAIDYSGTPGWPATWPADVRPGGVPDWTKKGPNWIMIGNEGGFLPQPVVIPAHPVNWNVDVTTFNAGNVNAGSLILAPAERADVIVDFCAFAGQTLILYNDAPAPWPALDPHYDYYTGSPDNTDMGGYTEVIPGFGPNIRTIMQINVASGGCTAYDSTNLFSAFTSSSQQTGVKSVFEIGQDPIIVAQGNINPTGDPAYYEAFPFDTAPYAKPYDAYNKAYDRTFPSVYPNWGLGQINSKTLNFKGFDADGTYNQSSYIYTTATVPHPLDPTINVHGGVPMMFKAIQDEQGETFDDYGRMRAALGIENITPGAGRVNFIVQTYNDPSTEILAPGATQVWKITHNGVDTHPIHFHLFDVQVINRVGWDGFLRLPDPTELGWKETVRISPLEDTIVALRPVQPDLPFGIPTSYRPKNPARPTGNLEMTELTQIEPVTGAIRDNHNEFISLGWEYVWHCHILSHEENDMMRPIIFNVPAVAPEAPVLSATLINPLRIDISWTDPVPVDPAQNEIGFLIERSDNGGAFDANFATALANETTYSDTNVAIGHTYVYRIRAYNAAGNSLYSNTASVTAEQVKKSNWIYATVNNTTGNVLVYWNVSLTPGVTYVLQQATNPSFTGATQVYNDTGSSTTVNVSTSGTYYYRVKATKLGMVDSVWTDSTGYAVALAAARPSFITVPGSSTTGNIALSWTASATPGVTYIVQQATNPSFTGATEVYNNTGTSTTVNVVTNSTYYYRVMATKTNYADSAWRQGVNGCVVNIFVPTAVTPNWIVVPANAPAGSIYVYWGTTSTPNATFVLEESKDLGAWTPVYSAALTPPATNRFVTLTGRTTGSYRYRVKVVAAGYIDSPYRTGTNPTIVP